MDEVVDLILLAHEDEFVVAMHDQFLGAVLELLAWGLEAHHGHAVLVMYLYVLDAAAYRVQGRVDLDDGVRPVDFDVIQIIAGHQMAHALAGIGLRVDDVAGADALQNARMLLGHGLGPQVGTPASSRLPVMITEASMLSPMATTAVSNWEASICSMASTSVISA